MRSMLRVGLSVWVAILVTVPSFAALPAIGVAQSSVVLSGSVHPLSHHMARTPSAHLVNCRPGSGWVTQICVNSLSL